MSFALFVFADGDSGRSSVGLSIDTFSAEHTPAAPPLPPLPLLNTVPSSAGTCNDSNLVTEARKALRTSSDGLVRFARALQSQMRRAAAVRTKAAFELVRAVGPLMGRVRSMPL